MVCENHITWGGDNFQIKGILWKIKEIIQHAFKEELNFFVAYIYKMSL